MNTMTNNQNNVDDLPQIWVQPIYVWVALGLVIGLVGLMSAPALEGLMSIWDKRPEYSYGYMVPFISLFLIWQRKDRLERIQFQGSWAGVLVLMLGVFALLLGRLSTLAVLEHYSIVIVIAGTAFAYVGWPAFKLLLIPILFLLFMVPIPSFLISEISQALQLISSQIGVWFIRLFGISVYLEGNIIDLGTYKLQVVEACSGLRYLFPLMAPGFMTAYFYTGAFWKRVFIFLSTIPITIIMNSFRIGAIGVLVEYWGVSMAEGFLHDFEGWVVFMACIGVLIVEMWVLANIGSDKRPLHEAFGIDLPAETPTDAAFFDRKLSAPFAMSTVVIICSIIGLNVVGERERVIPERKEFKNFPTSFAGWRGQESSLDQITLDVLDLDDYVLSEFINSNYGNAPVNLYIAYYNYQQGRKTSHTPKSCLPGGGWEIKDIREELIDIQGASKLLVNKVVIQKGEYRQLVYYWFKQRDRIIANEYATKWYLFWDGLTQNRTDGALVRLTAIMQPDEEFSDTEARLLGFVADLVPLLDEYIPD